MAQDTVFGRYELLRLVGSGGMAQVHLARQRGPEGFVKPCVLKRITPEQSHSSGVRRMFLEEARVSALLNHPNIVQTFDFGEVEGTPYLAMELVDGVNLAQLCRALAQHDRWMPLQPAIEIVYAVLEALDYAHRLADLDHNPLRLVHRDVSPQNTLLSRQGTVKLTDFGIARHEARDTRTVGPTAKGKPGYMAPEQAMSGEVDARADLFAVGVMLTELISARRVLTSKNRVNFILDIENRVRTLCALRKESPPELNELAVRLCSLEPGSRPASAREAATLLRKSSARVPPSVPLQDFLRSAFEAYLPAANVAQPPTAPQEARTIAEGPAITAPPEASESDLQFEQKAWEPSEAQQTATEAVYEHGWPNQYLGEERPKAPVLPSAAVAASLSADLDAPPPAAPVPPEAPKVEPQGIELVAHSSSVDAMQYFQAQVSDDLQQEHREQSKQPPPPTDSRTHRLPYVPGLRGVAGASPSRPEAPPPSGEQTATGLPMPVFDPPNAPAPEEAKKGVLGFEDPALKKALATIADDDDGKKRKPFKLPPVVPLLGVGLVVVALAAGVLALVTDSTEMKETVAPKVGAVEVSSDPPGGEIFLDGRRTGKRTPAVLEGLPTEKAMRLIVRRPNHRSVPPDVTVRIPQLSLRTTARFTLLPGRAYQVVSKPPDAVVTLNGHRLGELTPVTLPVVPFGESATITFDLDGFLPHRLVIDSRASTATIAEVELEPGRSIEISSNPPGAKVIMDGEPIGQTPLYEVLVPAERRFTLKLTHKGFKSWRKRFTGSRLPEGPVVADLKPLPFLALPWSKEEKKQARDLDREHTRLVRNKDSLERKLARAQKRQAVVEASVNASVGDLADVQRRTDMTRDALTEVEQTIAELEAQMLTMREQLLLRLDGE